MQDSKETSWATDYESDQDSHADDSGMPKTSDHVAGQRNGHNSDAEKSDGWQQYRKWISKAPAPRSRRSGLDPSLYTWKGYRNWTEQVKRNWSDS